MLKIAKKVADYTYYFLFTLSLYLISGPIEAQQIVLPSGSGNSFDVEFKAALEKGIDTIFIDQPEKPIITAPLFVKHFRKKVILFSPGTHLQAMPGAFKKRSASLITLYECDSIEIIGQQNTLKMQKAEYLDGEWRHVINLRGSRNIRIENLNLKESGGDGIYIAGSRDSLFSENIHIDNIRAIGNKRQGISIISAKGVSITNSMFTDTRGTFPGAGIDIEPNRPKDVIQDIYVENCVFENNFHAGVILNLGKLNSSSAPINIVFEKCILRNNHAEDNPKVSTEILLRSAKENPVKGKVTFKECLIEDSNWGMLYARKHADAFQVVFDHCTAKNICNKGTLSAIGLEVLDYKKIANDIGGYYFNELYLDYEAVQPFMTVRGSRRGTLQHLRDVQGKITLGHKVIREIDYINYDPKSNIDVSLEIEQKSPN